MYNIIPLATKALQYLSTSAQELQDTYLPHLWPASDTRPNILIILTDDQDDHMRSLDFMPNVREHIIDKGAYHSSHYCTIALCCPSRTSLWTGLHGHNHNVTDVGGPYGGYAQVVREGHNDDNLFLWIQEAGYTTYYAGKLYNGQDEDNYNNPPARGFDHSDLWVGKNVYWYDNVSHSIDFGPIQYGNGFYSTDLLAERIAGKAGYIEHAAKHRKPWLMVAAPVAPHVQIGPPELGGVIPPVPNQKYKDLYQDYKIPRTPDFNPDTPGGASYYRLLPKLNETMIEFNDEYQRRRLRALKSVDDMVGEIMDKLRATKQLDNTYVVFTTDNGFHIGQHRMTGGKECGLETTIRIPFAVRGPGVKVGTINPAISNHVDMSPTLMAIAGAPRNLELDGAIIPWTDNLGELNGEIRREHSSVEFWGDAMANMDGQTVSPWGPKGWANNTFYSLRLLGPDYNFYYCVWCTNEHEMYDMRNDPYQLNNLFYDPEAQQAFDFAGADFDKTVQRLDALLLTLKTCSGPSCRAPWRYMIEDGSVNSLAEAVRPALDSFFDNQPKVSYTACKMGHFAEVEGAQDVNRLDAEYNVVESGPLLWS